MNVKKTEGQTPEKVTPPSPTTPTGFLGLRDDFDHLFDSMMLSPFGRRLAAFDPFRSAGGLMKAGTMMPRMDVVELDKVFEITAELPGVDEADIDISIGEGTLTIRGEKKAESEDKSGDYHVSERTWGSFTRSFTLPESADEAHVTASFDKGVLSLTIPKLDKPAPARRKIEVKATHH
ncbi:MAG TPA: Hsp20/alpha crystallin family protein [Candidatus Sulfotelmatobacter sp.]|jgi:HSP20 family protein|nr:Hsp20/alpha crystallin family protein [Candidatus Sulfotelmatobacter sp.]